jgi:hypothetical protein
MTERRVLTEDEAFRMLAHLLATAELHLVEPPHYAGRRIVEGSVPLLDAMIRDGDDESREWLRQFRQRLDAAVAARRDDPGAFESFLNEAPGEIAREIKRRRAAAKTAEAFPVVFRNLWAKEEASIERPLRQEHSA